MAVEFTRPPKGFRWKLTDRVRKKSGSSWQGEIVGFYSTDLTPEGYCVESENEPGSVQIYPAQALELVEAVASSIWTAFNTERLKLLHSRGLSSGQIAQKIPGATAMAVVGKANRMGLRFERRRQRAAEKMNGAGESGRQEDRK